MNSPLPRRLREAAASVLPKGAFLKRDRGDALFVTDAPRLLPGADWPALLSPAGFRCEQSGLLLRLTPGEGWLARLEAEHPEPPDALCAGLRRFAGLPPEPESLALFALGARALDGGAALTLFDRRLRQRAATCLRLNRMNPDRPPQGGGLYACALLEREEREGGALI